MILKGNYLSNNIIILLLSPLFFYQLKIGNDEIVLHSYLFTILFSIILLFRVNKINVNVLIYITIFSLITIIYAVFNDNGLLSIKYLFLLLPAVIIPNLMTKHNFSESIIKLIVISLVCSVLVYFFNIGVDNSYGSLKRLQGFMSEPSAMALPITILLVYSLEYKINYLFLLSTISLILTLSPTVILIATTTTFIYFMLKINFYAKMLLSILVFFATYYSIDIFYFLSTYFPNFNIFNRIFEGLLYLKTGGESGYNTRFDFSYFVEKYITLCGYGLNTYPGGRDWNIHFETIYAFGVLGWIFFIVTLCFSLDRLYVNDKVSFIILLSTIIYSSLNSAQGIVLTIIIYTYIIFFIKDIKFVKGLK